MISVIIATKNRPNDIFRCIKSILDNKFQIYEIIIIDQSNNIETKKIIASLNNSSILYVKCKNGGKSHALNIGIKYAHGDILAFTDDDCVVNSKWLSKINQYFKLYPEIMGVLGKIKPYKPKKNANLFCPSIYCRTNSKIIKKPQTHWDNIGLGNNMSFRSSALQALGHFKEWLGYGAIGGPSEDAEMMLRMLIKGNILAYNPQALVYHNKWVTKIEFSRIMKNYIKSNIICYAYFSFQLKSFAYSIVKNEISEYFKLVNGISYLTIFIKYIREASVVSKQLIIALIYAIIDPVDKYLSR